MNQFTLNLCVRNPDPLIRYKYTSPLIVSGVAKESFVNFHLPTLKEEVKNLSPMQKAKYKKIALSFLATAQSFLLFTSNSMANTLSPTNPRTASDVPMVMPQEMMDILMGLLVIVIGAAIILSIILLVSAGVLRMLPKRKKEAADWTVDILKGVTQVLISPALVFLIYYLATKLFGGSGWFVTPF